MSKKINMSRRDFLRMAGMSSLAAGVYTIPGVGSVLAQDDQEVTIMFLGWSTAHRHPRKSP